MKALLCVCALAGAACLAGSASASVIANWTFETSAPTTAGPFSAELGDLAGPTSPALTSHAGTTTVSSPAGNGSAHSFSSNGWAVNDYYQFSTSTTNYSSITIQWDQTSSTTGPRDFVLQYSTDGTSFTQLGAGYSPLANAAPNNTWSSGTNHPEFTLGPIAGPATLDNQATIYFRIVMNSATAENGGTVASTGTDRVDNVIISGTAAPAPAGAMVLMGLGGMVARRRRR